MKGVFEGLLQKKSESYKLSFSMTGMTETSAASHIVLKVLLNAISLVNRI
jgi:hypothetical protein